MPDSYDNIPPAPDLTRSPYTDSHGRHIGASADQIVTPGIFDTAQVEAVLEQDEDGMRDHIAKLLERVQTEPTPEHAEQAAALEAVPAEPIETCNPTLPPPFDWRQIAHAEPGEDTEESQAAVPSDEETVYLGTKPVGSVSVREAYRRCSHYFLLYVGQRALYGWRLWLGAFALGTLYAVAGFVVGRS